MKAPLWRFLASAALFTTLSGCFFGTDSSTNTNFKLGDLIDAKFSPPATVAEVDKLAVKWVDMPVVDSMELMRERQAKETPAVSVAEALAMKNDTPENNVKILSALGRLPAKESDVKWDSKIYRHFPADVKSINPILISSTTEFDVADMIGVGLFGFDWNFNPYALKDTVVSWQTSEDRLYDKVVIRDDLTWSDGAPITAHDVEFSFKLILTESVPATAVRSGTDKLKYVKAYDDHTLVYFHKEKLATNVWNLNFPVVPKHIFEKTVAADPTLIDSDEHVKLEEKPISGGPYELVRREKDREMVFQRRESWYMHKGKQVRTKPHFETVNFQIITDPSVALLAMKKAEIDEMILTPEQWKNLTNDNDFYTANTKASGIEWVNFHFCYNIKTPFFSDVRVRQAMSLAFDHQRMIEVLRYGLDQPCAGNFHPDSKWVPKQWPPSEPEKFFNKQDLKRAEQLLQDAGWTDTNNDGIRDKMIDGRSVPFEFSILATNQPWRLDICKLLQQNLQQIGITCTVRAQESAVLQDLMEKHKFHAAFGGWGTGTDPDTSDNIWVTDQPRNYGNYSNKEVDKLFEQGRKEFDPEKRAAIYAKVQELLYQDQPYTWLFFRNSYYGFNKELRGYTFSPRGPYHYGPGFTSMWKPAAQ